MCPQDMSMASAAAGEPGQSPWAVPSWGQCGRSQRLGHCWSRPQPSRCCLRQRPPRPLLVLLGPPSAGLQDCSLLPPRWLLRQALCWRRPPMPHQPAVTKARLGSLATARHSATSFGLRQASARSWHLHRQHPLYLESHGDTDTSRLQDITKCYWHLVLYRQLKLHGALEE